MKLTTALDYKGRKHAFDADKIIDIEEVNEGEIKTVIRLPDEIVIEMSDNFMDVVKYLMTK